MTKQEQINNFLEYNCRFCKNQESCELYPFLQKPGIIEEFEIPEGKYDCSFKYRERGVRIVKRDTYISA